ncbi:putative disease resistance protein At3g14460 [Ziziphus jujuba]|uniref:Disease resistance protein At3g14460 n=1 Tax=Ziziphus jujuba TaxID=326968 RepID=A0ABM4A302_ZIZJJ|nr:putative disease resistance protein At3g14460 [Ziziphus jujuba]
MLPPLGQLPFLKKLKISGFDELVKVSNEFYCGGCSVPTRPFRCLESLYIYDMKKWEEWSFFEEDGDGAFPKLVIFNLENCPILNARICFPITIEEVKIRGCRKFEFSTKQQEQHAHLRNLGGLHIQAYEDACIALDYITMVTSFILEDCWNLKSLTYLQQPAATLSLKTLKLILCVKLESFPRGGVHAPCLEELEILYCCKLKSLPENMQTLLPSLHILDIKGCPEVESFPECPMPSNLQRLQIYECDKLLASRRHWDLQTLTSLSIGDIDELVLDSFPEEGLLPDTLINLSIVSLPLLEALNGKALRHLSSLEQLEISLCDELKCLPEEGLPTSLSVLDINECPLLEQRCQRETGEDWPKIAHIRHIKIDQQDI